MNTKSKMTANQMLNIKNPLIWDTDTPNMYKIVTKIFSNGTLIDQTETKIRVQNV
ncbi:MAG: hypothetical protein L6V93_10270 [Clostridiales bacterium]|nr:MAG: hypothetical protein L6V93_10270 [Clostridiales bacterium]